MCAQMWEDAHARKSSCLNALKHIVVARHMQCLVNGFVLKSASRRISRRRVVRLTDDESLQGYDTELKARAIICAFGVSTKSITDVNEPVNV